MRCVICSEPFPADADPRRETCSDRCRQARHRRKVAAKVEALDALLRSHPEVRALL